MERRDVARIIVADRDTGDEWAIWTGNAMNPRLADIARRQQADTSAVFVGVTINGAGPFTPNQVAEQQHRATHGCRG